METQTINKLTEEDHEKIHNLRTTRTVEKHKGKWIQNIRANADNIKKDLSLLWLDNPGPEIVSIAAGPSLSGQLEELKQTIVGKEVICVDASLKYCVENGIIPDYVICTDASEKILSMWTGMERIASKLILNVMASPAVVDYWGENIYWFVMANMIAEDNDEKTMQDMHSVESKIGTKLVPGGNVSSVALGFCLSIRNSEKVHLFGHDFCWKDDFYCGGQLKHLAQERMDMEGKAGTIFETQNTKGEKVYTNLSLKQYATWHQQAIVRLGHRINNHTSSTILKI